MRTMSRCHRVRSINLKFSHLAHQGFQSDLHCDRGRGRGFTDTHSQEEILHPRTHETDRGFRLPRPPGVTTNASTNSTHEPKGPRSSIAPRLPGPEGPLLELDDRALDLPGIPPHHRRVFTIEFHIDHTNKYAGMGSGSPDVGEQPKLTPGWVGGTAMQINGGYKSSSSNAALQCALDPKRGAPGGRRVDVPFHRSS